jgi:hypothetical protein
MAHGFSSNSCSGSSRTMLQSGVKPPPSKVPSARRALTKTAKKPNQQVRALEQEF